MGAENLSYLKSIETHARTFLPLNISAIGSVSWLTVLAKNAKSWKTGITLANVKYLTQFTAPWLSSQTLAAFGAYRVNSTYIH